MTARVFVFPSCRVVVGADEQGPFVWTMFTDHTEVDARIEDTDQARALAVELGYIRPTCTRSPCLYHPPTADLEAMLKDHDAAHSWLALPLVSHTLWFKAHGLSLDHDDVRDEEARVLALQRCLDKTKPNRPWDSHEETR